MKTATLQKTLCILLITVLLCATSANAYTEVDSDFEEEFTPQYIELTFSESELSIDNTGNANCRSNVTTVHSENTIQIQMELQQKQSSAWKSIKTWYVTDTNPCSVEKTYVVKKGYDYRVYVTATVYDRNGNQIEQGTQYSNIKHY